MDPSSHLRQGIREKTAIQSEIARASAHLKKLRNQDRQVELELDRDWDPEEVPQIEVEGMVWKKKEKKRRRPKTKQQKIDAVVMCLQEYGVHLKDDKADKLALALLECIRGDVEEEYKIVKEKPQMSRKKK